MSLLFIYAFVFSSVLLVADTLLRRVFARREARREINERLNRLESGGDQATVYQSLLKDRSLGKGTGRAWSIGRFRRYYAQSGLLLGTRQKVLWLLLVGSFAVFASAVLTDGPILRALISLTLTAGIIMALVARIRSRRLRKFVEQLPAAIDIIVRSLQAGHPLNSAIALVGREMPDPIGSEFGILTDQLTFGSEVDQAFLNLVERVGADDLNLLAVTVSVQRNTGGNLSEVLENLSALIRDRLMMRNKIKAISAEGRFTSVLMSVFPFVLYLIITSLAPTYFDPVWATGYGSAIVLGTLVYMGIGVLIMNRMVNFEI